MPRPKKQHAHENHERWLLTYADMITLLVAFFIMLYAMSVMNQHKFQQVALSVRSGFDGNIDASAPSILDGHGTSQGDVSFTDQASGPMKSQINSISLHAVPKSLLVAGDSKPTNDTAMDTTLAKLQAVISKDKLEDKVKVRSDERGIVVSVVTDKFLFDKGQASIRPQFDYVLDDISTPLRAVPNQIRVEGYTDDLPICTAQFPSNWELSTMRATVVLRYFLNHKELPEDRMSVAGYADTRPVVPNDSEEDRAHNRRVEIVVLKSSEVAEEEPTDTASPGSE